MMRGRWLAHVAARPRHATKGWAQTVPAIGHMEARTGTTAAQMTDAAQVRTIHGITVLSNRRHRHSDGRGAGYCWFARERTVALFPFGHGIRCSHCAASALSAGGGERPSAGFTIGNGGRRADGNGVQFYRAGTPQGAPRRLATLGRAEWNIGARRMAAIAPRVFAQWTPARWQAAGTEGFAPGRPGDRHRSGGRRHFREASPESGGTARKRERTSN